MNKTLKTYEDGSELTVVGLGIAMGVAAVATTGWIVMLDVVQTRRQRRLAKTWAQRNIKEEIQ